MSVRHNFFVRQNVRGRIPLGRPQVGFTEFLQKRGALRICLSWRWRCDSVPVVLVALVHLRIAPPTPPSAAARHSLQNLRLGKQGKVT